VSDALRHARASELFLHACELTAAERENYLQAACGADAALRKEVEDLLARDQGAEHREFLETPAAPSAGTTPIKSGTDLLGARSFEEALAGASLRRGLAWLVLVAALIAIGLLLA